MLGALVQVTPAALSLSLPISFWQRFSHDRDSLLLFNESSFPLTATAGTSLGVSVPSGEICSHSKHTRL